MYERFTDRARKVMQLANQEAKRFNHECIGTEHILIALVKEECGVAATVLKGLGVNLTEARKHVERVVQAGPEMITISPGPLPQTPRVRKVVEYSMEESRNLNHNYVGTEHILLGLLREQEGVAFCVLHNLGLTDAVVRDHVLKLLGINVPDVNTSVGKRIIASLQEFTQALSDQNTIIAQELTKMKLEIEELKKNK